MQGPARPESRGLGSAYGGSGFPTYQAEPTQRAWAEPWGRLGSGPGSLTQCKKNIKPTLTSAEYLEKALTVNESSGRSGRIAFWTYWYSLSVSIQWLGVTKGYLMLISAVYTSTGLRNGQCKILPRTNLIITPATTARLRPYGSAYQIWKPSRQALRSPIQGPGSARLTRGSA